MRTIIITIFSCAITFYGCYPGWIKGYYYWGNNDEVASCRRCSSISSISTQIAYLDIEDWKCTSIPENWNFPNLKSLSINSNKVKFPTKSPSRILETISILDPILDSIPQFVFDTEELEGLIVFLYDGQYLDNVSLSKLRQLKRLKIGLLNMDSIPSFIYSLENLEELVLFSKSTHGELVFDDELLNLERLETLEAPIDLNKNSEVLSLLPLLKNLHVQSFSNFMKDGNIQLSKFAHLNEICVQQILPEYQAMISEIIPSVKFVCRDVHITPSKWDEQNSK